MDRWGRNRGSSSRSQKNEKYFHVYHSCKSRSYQDGGIIVFSLKKNAVQRWLLTAHSCAFFVDKCRMMTGNKEEDHLHEEAGKFSNETWKGKESNGGCQQLDGSIWTIRETCQCYFWFCSHQEIKLDLLAAKEKGTAALTAFLEDRLLSDSVGFFEPLSKLKLGTFRDLQKKTTASMVTGAVRWRAGGGDGSI